MVKLTTVQSDSQNGYFSIIAATQPFAVPNTDSQRLPATIMIKDNIKIVFEIISYIMDCTEQFTH